MTDKTTWIIGADAACDIAVASASVSWNHCRLRRLADGYEIEDLGSTNGTYVNGQRISGPTRVSRVDSVMLGHTVALPWPAEVSSQIVTPAGATVIHVGREPDNDVVLDNPEVSGRHARVLVTPGASEGVVEDLGSKNGTAVGIRENAVARAVFTVKDTLLFGPVAVPGSRFLEVPTETSRSTGSVLVFKGATMTVGRDPACDHVIDLPMVSSRHARLVREGSSVFLEDLGSSNGTFVNGKRVVGKVAVGSGDPIALGSYVLRLVDGSVESTLAPGLISILAFEPAPTPARASSRPSRPIDTALAAGLFLVLQQVVLALVISFAVSTSAGRMFGLAVVAAWTGLSSVGALWKLGAVRPESWAGFPESFPALGRSFGIVAALDFSLAFLLFGVVGLGRGLGSSWPEMFGLVWLTSLAGSAIGMTVASSVRPSAVLPPVVAAILVLMVIGGPFRPLPSATAPERVAAAAFPARWAFEGLMLIEAGPKVEDPSSDPVQPYFPSETDRMGVPACASALVALALGLVYASAVIASARAN